MKQQKKVASAIWDMTLKTPYLPLPLPNVLFYFALFQSHINYGIINSGSPSQTDISPE